MRVRHKRTLQIDEAHIRFSVSVGYAEFEIDEFTGRFELIDEQPDPLWSQARRWFSRTYGEPRPVLQRAKLRLLPFRAREVA